MNKFAKISASALLGGALLATAACGGGKAKSCSAEELQAKATELSEKIQKVAMENPEKVQAFSEKAAELSKMGADGKSVGEICKAYDELLEELN